MAESSTSNPMVAVSKLRKTFDQRAVLNGVDFDVPKGETLAVLGQSGTGKSVLLKLMVGLQEPDAGEISICGQTVSRQDRRELTEIRKKVGFLFQQAALYDSLTVAENVEFPLARHTALSDEERRQKVGQLLSDVGLQQDRDKMPSEISGGMQKRVGLARALALDPDVLLLDEPTAGLDPLTAAEIGKLFCDLKEKRQITSVVVTHDVRGAKAFADRLMLLHEGNILDAGSFSELQHSRDPFVAQFMAAG